MKKILFAAIAAALSFTAQAQNSTDVIEITEEERALALSVFTNGECFATPESEDGTLQWEGHGGLYGLMSANTTLHSFSNNDGVGDTGSKSTFGGDLGLGYRLVRTDWPVAVLGEVYGGANSTYHVENRIVGTHVHFGARALVELSHGAVLPAVGIGYGYENGVSENADMDPWRGNLHELDLIGRVSVKLFSIRQNKTARVGNKRIPVRGLREVKLFAQCSYGVSSVKKYWDGADAKSKGFQPELKDKKLKIEVGFTFNIR